MAVVVGHSQVGDRFDRGELGRVNLFFSVVAFPCFFSSNLFFCMFGMSDELGEAGVFIAHTARLSPAEM